MSKHHDAAGWASVTKGHRARLSALRVHHCLHCGRPVDTVLDAWDVSHVRDLAAGGEARDVGVAHRACNRSAGGSLGARIRRAQARDADRIRAW